jgi:FkbM family methyltransferase
MVRKLTDKISGLFKKRSYALNNLDLKLLRFLNYRGGIFVEAGANDGIRQSNTLYYEKYKGWTGLLIEAIPALAEQCRQNRPRCLVENCALVSADYNGKTVEMEYFDLMSIVKDGLGNAAEEQLHKEAANNILREGKKEPYRVAVPARTLSQVLTAHRINKIDLLSLDVEGYEANVLSGIDFNKHTPKFMLVETRHNKKTVIDNLLAPHYEQMDVLNTNDRFADILFRRRN